ncbi:glycoside hydrolase family 99-like domain-containing protein [Leadbetterella sp. DM7]|uniref:glycoside hydrolase family 99-like domain-containing protein n=1 Tax=Leadbetterella sp. DM7 TaxID=3235085 RepID=UPI00349EA71D
MPKALAIYLPQYHPVPENDAWWGKGFTEWTNVSAARPLFKGHYQPQLPTDNGYYDLRVPETREAQAQMAREYGIDGFCYYHYWFSGKRLLHQPIDEVLASGKPDFPFCYFWANESWSRRWEGKEQESVKLIEQKYSDEDHRAHAEWLVSSFKDERYIKINGRPLFLVYKPFDLPDAPRMIAIFEEVCRENGIPKPYFVGSNSHDPDKNPADIGFDCAIHFQTRHNLLSEFWIDGFTPKRMIRNLMQGILNPTLKVYDYKQYKERARIHKIRYKGFPCPMVGFDNTARKGKNAVILANQNVEDFKASLVDALNDVKDFPEEEQIVFVNSWNEWAEGNHLEPCVKFGRDFLKAVQEVFGNKS